MAFWRYGRYAVYQDAAGDGCVFGVSGITIVPRLCGGGGGGVFESQAAEVAGCEIEGCGFCAGDG